MSTSSRPFVKNCPDFLPEYEQRNVLRWTNGIPGDEEAIEFLAEQFDRWLKDFPEPHIRPDGEGELEILADHETTFKFPVPRSNELLECLVNELEMVLVERFTNREILENIFCSVSWYTMVRFAPKSVDPNALFLTIYWEFSNDHNN